MTNTLYFAGKRHLQSNSCTSHLESCFTCGVSSLAWTLLTVPTVGTSIVGQQEDGCSFSRWWQRALSFPSSRSGATHPLQCPLLPQGTGPHSACRAQIQVLLPANKIALDGRKKKYQKLTERCPWKFLRHVSVEDEKSTLDKYIFSSCPLSMFWISETQRGCLCAFTQVSDSGSWTALPSWEHGTLKSPCPAMPAIKQHRMDGFTLILC